MIYAFGHEPNTGKDTLVMFIIDHLRAKFKNLDIPREGFADRIYDLCHSLYGWAGFQTRHYYAANPKAKEVILPLVGKTPRQLVIGIAEHVRMFDPSAWLRPVFLNKPKHAKFITDLRTFEEVQEGKKLGAYLVRIDRPDAPKIECTVSAILRGWDGWDETLVNDGDMTKWRETAIAFAERKVVPGIQKILLSGNR
jgi:hypothetical protein